MENSVGNATNNSTENQNVRVKDLLEHSNVALAITIALIALFAYIKDLHPYIKHWVIWFLVLGILFLLYSVFATLFLFMRKKKMLVSIIVISAIALGYWQYNNNDRTNKFQKEFVELEKKLSRLTWIIYEPIRTNPYKKPQPPITEDEIRNELTILRTNTNFDGIITISSAGINSRIPEIAKSVRIESRPDNKDDVNSDKFKLPEAKRFEGVIMGILNIDNENELINAINAKEHVDGYCVGNNFPDKAYVPFEVLEAIERIRNSTGKPVTTTLPPNGYSIYSKISNAIDWFFPDVHSDWYFEESADKAYDQLKDSHILAVKDIQKEFPDKPIMLKMISFPSKGSDGGSEEEQYKFFRKVVEYVKSNMAFPERVYASYFSAYDIMWKTEAENWPPREQFVGLLNSNGEPKKLKANDKTVISAFEWSRTSAIKRE